MKIGIEAQRLFRKNKHGIELVALELIKNLQVLDKENKYFVFVKPDEDNTCIQETENFRIIQIKGCTYPFWEQIAMPRVAKKYGCDILHCTSNTAPLFTNIPLIVTLHDIIYLEKTYAEIMNSKGTSYQKYGNIYRRMVVPQVVKKAKIILTVSHSEKNKISTYFGIRPDDSRLDVVYNGVSDEFGRKNDDEMFRQLKQLYNLPNHFILFLGNTDEKKNTGGVLKAYSEYLKMSDKKYHLVIPDFKPRDLNQLLADIGNNELKNYIRLIGYVPNHHMPGIYNLSTLFLYPSLRESFGIPILEAMKCGTPVITSNTSSMPEVAGGSAILVNPCRPEEITQAILNLLNNENLINELVLNGQKQAKKFSWKKMAEEVLMVYTQLGSKI